MAFVQMLVFQNTQEHTLPHLKQLFAKCGWQMVKVVKKKEALSIVCRLFRFDY